MWVLCISVHIVFVTVQQKYNSPVWLQLWATLKERENHKLIKARKKQIYISYFDLEKLFQPGIRKSHFRLALSQQNYTLKYISSVSYTCHTFFTCFFIKRYMSERKFLHQVYGTLCGRESSTQIYEQRLNKLFNFINTNTQKVFQMFSRIAVWRVNWVPSWRCWADKLHLSFQSVIFYLSSTTYLIFAVFVYIGLWHGLFSSLLFRFFAPPSPRASALSMILRGKSNPSCCWLVVFAAWQQWFPILSLVRK